VSQALPFSECRFGRPADGIEHAAVVLAQNNGHLLQCDVQHPGHGRQWDDERGRRTWVDPVFKDFKAQQISTPALGKGVAGHAVSQEGAVPGAALV